MAGKSVRLFLADGTPGGLLAAEIMNWTGHIVAAPRSELAAVLKRSEARRTGVYVLIGENPECLGGIEAYVGEGDDVGDRLYHHARPSAHGGKDFWGRGEFFTPQEVSELLARIAVAGKKSVKKVYDPACGSGLSC